MDRRTVTVTLDGGDLDKAHELRAAAGLPALTDAELVKQCAQYGLWNEVDRLVFLAGLNRQVA